MTEQEYIDATNLCKLRIAIDVLRGYVPSSIMDTSVAIAIKNLYYVLDKLEGVVVTGEK